MAHFDVRYKHPFNMVISGPTRSGKTTWVETLLIHRSEFLNAAFDYINIFLGTTLEANSMASAVRDKYGASRVRVVDDIKERYDGDVKKMKREFPKLFVEMFRSMSGKGLIIFDDLMSELNECDVLEPLFTKWSSHYDISTIHITQNVGYVGSGGKQQGTAKIVYRNTKYLLLYHNPMDKSVFEFVGKKLNIPDMSSREVVMMLISAAAAGRGPILIDADVHTPDFARVRCELFGRGEDGTPFQSVVARSMPGLPTLRGAACPGE